MKPEVVRIKVKPAVDPAILSSSQIHVETKINSEASLECLAVGTEMRFYADNELQAELFLNLIANYIQEPVIGLGSTGSSFKLKKAISAQDLRWIASVIHHGQCIAQTIAEADCYTGIENADWEVDILNTRNTPEWEVLDQVFSQSLNIKRSYVVRSMYVSTVHDTIEGLCEESGYLEPSRKKLN
jgi:hypothetical protein